MSEKTQHKPLKEEAELAKAYKVKKGEEKFFHVILSKPLFDRATGQRKDKPYPSIMPEREYKNFMKSAGQLGFQVLLVHDPLAPKKATAKKKTAEDPATNPDMLG